MCSWAHNRVTDVGLCVNSESIIRMRSCLYVHLHKGLGSLALPGMPVHLVAAMLPSSLVYLACEQP